MHHFPRDVLQRLYHALIECHLIYAIPECGSTFQTYLDKLIAYQNKAVKTIANGKWNNSSNSLYMN